MGEGEGEGVRAIRRGFAYSDAVGGCLSDSWGEFSESDSQSFAPISRPRPTFAVDCSPREPLSL